MVLRLYNTLTRTKEVFTPFNAKEVKMYSCGPTVYATPHIGNYRSFLVGDLIRRYLEYKGYTVRYVMNITDIDDKTIRDSQKAGLSLNDFTEKYTEEFLKGLEILNIKKATVYPRATKHVNDMLKMTKTLIEKGFAYPMNGSVYFDISKFKEYGKLSKIDLDEIKAGFTVDVDEYEKDDPKDFALMKRSTPDEINHNIYFESEWGKVRPGWHIECSVLSMKFLGDKIDIHTGGVDLIFPHHENEIAQSEAYTGKKVVKYWVHIEHLLVNGEKMSKSLGNYITLQGLQKKIEPGAIRYFLLSAHYRKKLNYTDEAANQAQINYLKLKETFDRLTFYLQSAKDNSTIADADFIDKINALKNRFIEALDDDLNTPLALRVFHMLAREINKKLDSNADYNFLVTAYKIFNDFAEILGFKFEEDALVLSDEVKELIDRREEARKRKDWKTADMIRAELRKMGVILLDTPKGVRIKLEKS
ncbi:MAG: cysteine--tRNA ligase [Candidatus Odinarchaeia archaeon]